VLGSVAAVAAGLVILIFASDRLVASAVHVSQALGVSAILIGAIVVGLGTSLPELLVSALAAADGELDVAVANVAGSNITNVTLVLGSAAILVPVASRIEAIRREGLLMVGSVILFAIFAAGGSLGRLQGVVLLLGMAVSIWLLVRWSLGHGPGERLAIEEFEDTVPAERKPIREMAIGVAALVTTVVGANLLLDGALDVGERLGLTSTFLGVMLGIGTSLPEMATALAAARRSAPDLVVGNVVGSNLFNSLAVAGTAAVVGPGPLTEVGSGELASMVGAVLLAGVFARTGRVVRWEAVVLLVVFFAFTISTY